VQLKHIKFDRALKLLFKRWHVLQDLSTLCTEVIDCISRRTATQENYEQQLNDLDHHKREFKPKQTLRKSKDWMVKVILKLKDAADVNAVAQQLCLIEMVSRLIMYYE